jgi:hypothetical protein
VALLPGSIAVPQPTVASAIDREWKSRPPSSLFGAASLPELAIS